MATFDEIRQRISKPMKGYVDKMLKENQNFLNKGKNFVNPSSSNVSTSPYKIPKRKIPKRVGPVVNDYLGESSPWIEDKKDREYVSPYMERFKDTDWQPKKVEKELPKETGWGVDYGRGSDFPYAEEVVESIPNPAYYEGGDQPKFKTRKKILKAKTAEGLKQEKLIFIANQRNQELKSKKSIKIPKDFNFNFAVDSFRKKNPSFTRDRAVQYLAWDKKPYEDLLKLDESLMKKLEKAEVGSPQFNILGQKIDDLKRILEEKHKEYEDEQDDNVTFEDEYRAISSLAGESEENKEYNEKYGTPFGKNYLGVEDKKDEEPYSSKHSESEQFLPKDVPEYLEESPVVYGDYIMYNGALYSKEKWKVKLQEIKENFYGS